VDNGFTALIGYDDMLISGFAAGVQGTIGIGTLLILNNRVQCRREVI